MSLSSGSKSSRRPKPGSQFKSARPCRSAADVAKRQQETLVQTVNEAKEAEEKRLASLSRTLTKSRANELKERHDRERERDRARIEMLVAELDSVKKLTNEGGIDTDSRIRSTVLPVQTMDVDRFGQDHMRTVHAKWIDRLDVLERRFNNSGKQRYNEYDERKRVKSLSKSIYVNCNTNELYIYLIAFAIRR